MLKRAIIYIRVSDPSQVDNNSLETQEDACRKYADRGGYEVIAVFKEEGVTGKHTNRDQLKKLLVFCYQKKNQIDAVIVYKLWRFSRNTENGLELESYLSKKGIQVLSASEPISDDPIGRFVRTMIYATGQLDNEIKGAIVKDNMQAVFRSGIWCWKCPIGYKRPFRTKEENKGKPPIKIPELEEIIVSTFQEAAIGIHSRQQLANNMNMAGFKRYFSSDSTAKIVERIVKNPFYYGNMYAKKWNEFALGKHEPMIDENTWLEANVRLFGTYRKYKMQDNSLFPLKGLLKCEICGHEMTSSNPKGRSKQYLHYECGNKACRALRIDPEKAHIEFTKLLRNIKPTSRVLKLFVYMIFDEWDTVIDSSKTEIDRLDDQIRYQENELRMISHSLDKRIYTEEMAQKEADKTNLELTLLKVRRSDIRIEQYDAEKVKNFTEHFLKNLDSLWLRLDDLPKKQALQSKIFPDGVILTLNKKIRTASLSPAFALIDTLSSTDSTFGDPDGIRTRDLQDENLTS